MEYTDEYIDGRQVVIVDGPIELGGGAIFQDIHIKFRTTQIVIIDGYGLLNNVVIDQRPKE